MGGQADGVVINDVFHLCYKIVRGLSCNRSQLDFNGFLRVLWFPPSSKPTHARTYMATRSLVVDGYNVLPSLNKVSILFYNAKVAVRTISKS